MCEKTPPAEGQIFNTDTRSEFARRRPDIQAILDAHALTTEEYVAQFPGWSNEEMLEQFRSATIANLGKEVWGTPWGPAEMAAIKTEILRRMSAAQVVQPR